MATKLERQMALKKKLEEEYREANERLNDRISLSRPRKYYPMSFDLSTDLKYKPLEMRRRVPQVISEEEPTVQEVTQLNVQREQEAEEAQRRLKEAEEEEEEIKRRDEEERRRREEEDRKRREELERRTLEDKKRKENARRKKAERRRIEMNEIVESRKLMINEDAKFDKQEDLEKVKLDEEQFEEMKKTEDRIKELELSIATLDMELERFDLEKMRCKTREVKKRMSLVIHDREEEADMILVAPAVRGFMQNDHLWGKYLRRGSVA